MQLSVHHQLLPVQSLVHQLAPIWQNQLSSTPRSVFGEDKNVKVSSTEEKRHTDSQDTKPTTGSSKSKNSKGDWTVVSYERKSTGQQGRRGKPYDTCQFGYRHNNLRGGFVGRGKSGMREPDKWKGRHKGPLQRPYKSPRSQSEYEKEFPVHGKPRRLDRHKSPESRKSTQSK